MQVNVARGENAIATVLTTEIMQNNKILPFIVKTSVHSSSHTTSIGNL